MNMPKISTIFFKEIVNPACGLFRGEPLESAAAGGSLVLNPNLYNKTRL
jgi:hypothetical protein